MTWVILSQHLAGSDVMQGLSVEKTKSATLMALQKTYQNIKLLASFSFFSSEAVNKQGVHPWPRNASKSTHLLGLHVEQGAAEAA